MNKVYCQDCWYYRMLTSEFELQFLCGKEKIENDIWGNKKGTKCIVKNQDFDCKDYEEI